MERSMKEPKIHVTDLKDPSTGLPVYSLYGKTRKATPDMLKDIDVLVYDIQDIGCRSFTYISTMGLAMLTPYARNDQKSQALRTCRVYLYFLA